MSEAAGIDRWRGGWIVAERSAQTSLRLSAAAHVDELVPRLSGHAAVAIDMPLALMETGTRAAEAQVRAVLGSSARSVFTSPTRDAVHASTQNEATERNRARGGPGISAQAYGLFASIRELRSALLDGHNGHWWETHPETAFCILNAGVPLPSKRSGLGAAHRLALLRPIFDDLDGALLSCPPKVPLDDVLDAVVALWSAERIRSDSDRRFGPEGRDDQGFAHAIRV